MLPDSIIELIVKTGFEKGVKSFKNKIKIKKASENYAKKYRSRYGSLKVLGMSKGLRLESVYTPLHFKKDVNIGEFGTVTLLEDRYRDSQELGLSMNNCRSENGMTIANDNQYLMVLGTPGSGKSTFLRRIGLEAFKGEQGELSHNCIPVLLEFKQINTENIDLIEAIAEEFTHFGFPSSKEFATKLLEQGKLLILLDGLDEVRKCFTNAVMNEIDDLVTLYEQNRFIVSCRIAEYRSNFKHDFQVIELADFDDKQIEQFIKNWFISEPKTAEKCWETLNQDNNKAAKELAQTPLLLTFLCLVYSRNLNFPIKRSRLYNKALDILLEEWAAEKRVLQEDIYKGLHTDLEKAMLAEIAYEGFNKDELFFQRQHLVERIQDFLADTVDNPQFIDGKKILKAIAAQQGILVKRAENIYSFSHLTLQEYLTAQYISQKDSRIQELVTNQLTEERWREVFFLVAGIKDNASEMLNLMENKTQQYINTHQLEDLLIWVEKVTDTTPGDFKPVSKRAIAIANAIAIAITITIDINDVPVLVEAIANAEAYALAFAFIKALAKANQDSDAIVRALALAKILTYYEITDDERLKGLEEAYRFLYVDKEDKDIVKAPTNDIAEVKDIGVRALENIINYIEWSEKMTIYQNVDYTHLKIRLEEVKKQIPDDRDNQEVKKFYEDLVGKIVPIWLEFFEIDQKKIDITESELKALENYLYANLLMVECKEAAVRVSKETWKDIEARMLLPVK
ncbi:MAG: NACHT domain-containing protein [Xenococcaceae cyanobacterium MO_188.B29]|nr:NACHT domain-containing protein [Xenococcaceae cyanobacterium MO_188.B29]